MTDTGIRVLLVDDEADLITYLEKRLTNKGFAATGVTAGRDALVLAENEVFDVAVVDLRMPGMDGLEVLKRLKEMQPFLRVLVLTGHGSLETAMESGTHDAFRYLEKPHDFSRLVRLLRAAHQAKRSEQQQCYEAEMERLFERRGISPQVILAESKRLQLMYEQ